MNLKERGILHTNSSAISLAHRLLDLAVITLSAYVAGTWASETGMRPEHWVVIFLSLLIFHFLTELNHVYGSWRGERITDELLKIATYWVLTFATVFMVDYFFFDQSYLSPGVMQGWLGLTLGTLCGYRVLLRSIMHSLRKAGINARPRLR